MSQSTETLLSPNACIPVQEEFGSPPSGNVDVELLQDPEVRGIADGVAEQEAAAYAYLERGEQTGKAAATALKNLGCVAC